MLKIGEISKICNVSIQTLRYYDKMGILCADFVDESSGYRYYSPDKIKKYQQIAHLKEMNFSLAEIKKFLDSERDAQLKLYARKKRKMEEKIRTCQETIQQIDKACSDAEMGILSYNYSLSGVSFEDDPAVVGRWKYLGDVPQNEVFESAEKLVKKDILLNDLFFLPGGDQFWVYCWTKGILYCIIYSKNIIVPNEYTLFQKDGKEYLALNWMVDKCISDDMSDCIRIYEKLDGKAYTRKQTYLYTDDTEMQFVPDKQVVGSWEAFDLIEDINGFSPNGGHADESALFINRMEFYERGGCCKYFASGIRMALNYTKGYIMDSERYLSEHYTVKTADGKDYLIAEHKSADYLYTGKVFCYYVYRRNDE